MSGEPVVVVIGGGYGGVSVAKALDDVAKVVLVEPKDAFQHNIAALRGLVDPDWTDRTFLPYDKLLTRGSVIRDRAVEVDQHGAVLASGRRLPADYLVLATGSTYPFPAKSAPIRKITPMQRLTTGPARADAISSRGRAASSAGFADPPKKYTITGPPGIPALRATTAWASS